MQFEKVVQLTDRQARDLHRMYQEEWWTKGRGLEDVRRMLEHTSVIVGFCDAESKRLVAFARVLTDYVYKALVLDVIVETGSRGRGLARALMEAIVGHPSLASVRHFELYCRPELMPLYRRWGFSDELGDLRLMRRAAPGTPQPSADKLATGLGG
jgi:GNAT superfamily N-acetyltransferase